jgi:hypothetical protein
MCAAVAVAVAVAVVGIEVPDLQGRIRHLAGPVFSASLATVNE